MTFIAKSVVRQFYDSPAQASCFNGCSTGGGQGFGEVQRYPEDYDGVLAGAPQDFATHIRATAIWNGKATLDDPASYIPPAKLPQITAAVLAHCGTPGEVADGFLQNPQLCKFDPSVLTCAAGQDSATSACFSRPQIAAIRKLYQGSAYAARETLEFAAALSLLPCFTPVRSPESNGVSEAFVKTLKRDYTRIQPRPDALTVLQQLPAWIDDYNENHPHSGLRMRSPREFIQAQSQPASCPV